VARIRTIKPEFWQSEKLAAMSEHARLMAIALLNHADDEGYFMANVALVRAACFPFEDDSTKCRRSLDDLSCKGFVTIVDASNKQIGHVNNFLEHQRIDRPKKSTLKDAFIGALAKKPNVLQTKIEIDEASTNARRMIDDASLLEQGTGNREMEQGNGKGEGKERSPSHAMKVANFVSKEFRGTFEKWRKYSAAKGKYVDDIAEEMQVMTLQRAAKSEQDAIEMLRYTMSRNVVGLITTGEHRSDESSSPRQALQNRSRPTLLDSPS